MTQKFIYTTRQISSDGSEIKHANMVELGIGETNYPERRFNEHVGYGGSKSSVGINLTMHVEVEPILTDRIIHSKLVSLGYFNVTRNSVYNDIKVLNRTEIYSGTANKTIEGIVNKGDQISEELVCKLIEIEDPDVFKNDLILKPHQQEAIDFIYNRFINGETDVLLNHKARSGKSFIMYDFLINNTFGVKNTLLLTQYPILNGQWEKELSNIKGHNINIINCSDLEDNKGVVNIEKDRPNLVMVSLQDAKGKNDEDISDLDMFVFLHKQKFSELKNIEWDLIIFDEVHKGKETSKTDKLLEGLKYKKLIGLSATPTKNITRGTFIPENIHVYDLISERLYKEKYGRDMYNLPDIRFNLMYCNEIKNRLKYFEDFEEFNFDKFFKVENDQLYYYDDISLFFQWIFTMNEFDGGQLSRIRRNNGYILIFVPNNKCQNLLVECLKNTGGRFRNYNITYTNSDVHNSKQLLKLVDDLDNQNKKSIIFSNRQLTTGITLKKCDIVMFMNEWKNMDEYIQASYRCQSPSVNKNIVDVYDFNPSRAFITLYDYIKKSSIGIKNDTDKSIRTFLRCANVNIYEYGEFKEIDFDKFKNNLLNSIFFKSKNIFKSIKNQIDINSLSDETKKNILDFGNFSYGKSKSTKNKLNDDARDSGKTYNNEKSENDDGNENGVNKNNDDSLILENIEYIVSKSPLLSYFIGCTKNNIDTIFDFLDNDIVKINYYVDSLLLSTNKDNITIYNDIKKMYNSFSNYTKEIIDDFISKFNIKYDIILSNYYETNDIIMYIDEIINLIDSYIGVSESEKKLLGEVFTPFGLIDEMLDTLPKEVWSNPNLKWLDPANGIGNFPIMVVKRLLDGLVDFEPDYDKRYKHIMENMIYVCDINPKNMFIFNNLFNPNNDVKLNSFRGSFLDESFDIIMKDGWGIEKFDIVMGNPPYQGTGRKKLHILFTHKILNYMLNKNGYLLFITPKISISFLTGIEINQKKINNLFNIIFIKEDNVHNYFNNIGSDFCYFLVQNNDYTITNINNKFNFKLNFGSFVPFNINSDNLSICKKCFNNNNDFGRKAARISDNLFDDNIKGRNKIVYKIKTNNIEYKWTNREHKDMFKPKVLFPTVGDKYIIDYDNNLFPGTSFVVYVVTKNNEESENLIKIINSKLYKYLCILVDTMRSPSDFVIKNLKKIDLSKSWTDEELYKYFNLTQEEIDLIEKTVK